jgi:Icc protein
MDVGSQWMDTIALQNANEVQALLKSIPNLRFICCGHVHHEFHLKLGEIDVFTTPSTGIQFDPAGLEPAFLSAPPGYRIFEFNGRSFTTSVHRMPEVRFHPNQ